MSDSPELHKGGIEIIGTERDALRFVLEPHPAPIASGDGRFDLLQQKNRDFATGHLSVACDLGRDGYGLSAEYAFKTEVSPEAFSSFSATAAEALYGLYAADQVEGKDEYYGMNYDSGTQMIAWKRVDTQTAIQICVDVNGVTFDVVYDLGTQRASRHSAYTDRSPRDDSIMLLRTVHDVLNKYYQGVGEAGRVEAHFVVPPKVLANIPESNGDNPLLPAVRERPVTVTEKVDHTRSSESAFDKFGGLDREIREIKTVLAAWQNPEVAQEYGIDPPTAILLYGPGGVGKTELARATAQELGAELFETKVPDIISTYANGSAEKLQALFNKVQNVPGIKVVFLNEFDGLFSQMASGNSGVATTLVAAFKGILTDLRTKYPGTLVIADSNDISSIDPALLRKGRFDTVLHIEMPNVEARTAIFAKQIERHAHLYDMPSGDGLDPTNFFPGGTIAESGSVEPFELAMAAEGFSGADVEGILKDARLSKMMARIATGQHPGLITQKDIVRAIEKHKATRPSKTD